MDDRIKHIIESGQMEAYLLGHCSPEEEQEIDALLEQSEDLRAYLDEIEDVQLKLTEKVSMTPPPEMKSRIRDAIRSEQEDPVQPFKKPSKQTSGFNGTWFLTLILCVACLFLALKLFTDRLSLERENERLELLLKKQEMFRSDLDKRLNTLEQQLYLLKDPETAAVSLQSDRQGGLLHLVAYWNDNMQSAFLSVENLPELPDNECFQLWADVDGAMVSLGVVKDAVYMAELEYLEGAESLNVTIEPEGGSDHPNVERLVVSRRF